MIVVGIDPGTDFCGVAKYSSVRREVLLAESRWPVATLIDQVEEWADSHLVTYLAIERVQSYGIAGGTLLRTSEVVGRLWQAWATSNGGADPELLYRREVLKALDVTGKGNRDSLVRQRMIEMHGGTRAAACGKKAAPGPLYGVAGHAWQALAVAVVVADREPCPCQHCRGESGPQPGCPCIKCRVAVAS